MPDKLSPAQEAEIDRWIAEFRTGVMLTDPDTKVKWEFISDLPDGGMTIRKIGTTGNRAKHEWNNWKTRLEFELLIDGYLRLETKGLDSAIIRLTQLRSAIDTFRDHGTIDPSGLSLIRYRDGASPYGIAAAKGADEALSAWIAERPAALREILNKMAGNVIPEKD